MFPGYDQGETTQRIASAIFKQLEGFKYGLQLASFYVPGEFVPHIRMLRTNYEDIASAKLFGMPYVTTRKPQPFDTTLLNYNWQIWNTSAFSLYSGLTDSIDVDNSRQAVESVIRFLNGVEAVESNLIMPGFSSNILNEDEMLSISAGHAGIYVRQRKAGDKVMAGEILAHILHPYDGHVLEEVRSPRSGLLFFSHHRPFVLQNAMLYRLMP